MIIIQKIILFLSLIYAIVMSYKIMKNHAKSVRLNKLLNKYSDFENMSIKEIEQAKLELAEFDIKGSKDKSVYERESFVYSTISTVFAIITVSLISVVFLPVFSLKPTATNMMLIIVFLLASCKFFEFYKISKINYKLSKK